MDVYELFLTRKCTRQCDFCYVQQSDFVESLANIEKFIAYVEKAQRQYSHFHINFFGGEPLLNFEGIEKVVDKFKDYQYCQLNLITNGDLIGKLLNYKDINKLNVQISAYDIFNDQRKYEDILNLLHNAKSIILSYTFTENDIDKIYLFQSICNKLNVTFKIAFSHSPSSWSNISSNYFYQLLYEFYRKELYNYINQSNIKRIPSTIERYLKRSASLIFDKKIQQCNCLTQPKNVFYDGKFIGPCIRFNDTACKLDCQANFERCNGCQYKMACSKICMKECIRENDVPEKLCMIEKAPFDVIFQYISNNIKNDNLKIILKYLLEDMLGIR